MKKAYEETVMAVPHYTETYDETPIESMAAELSEEVAAAVEREPRLHPPLERSLLETTEQAVSSRRRILEAIETELDAVETAADELRDLLAELDSLLGQPLSTMGSNALRLTGDRLRALRERCDELAAKRQRRVRTRRDFHIVDDGLFERHLYQGCEYTYPILAAIGRFGTLLETALRYVERRLAGVA